MNPTRVTKYQCPSCGVLHDHDFQAEDCCPPEVDEVTCWECPVCFDVHEDEEKARHCCLDEDVILPATPAQLEAAGQQRLRL